jgi:ABC-type glycerol-3-phosphate transport system substrate-binding protein
MVVAQEELPALDAAVGQSLAEVGRALGTKIEIEDEGAFLGAGQGAGGDTADTLAHRLLVAVQAGVPPDALLFCGRQAQTARLHAMELVQDVSGLLRTTRQRYGRVAPVTEVWHVVAGNWFAVPYYQRLVGHWVRPEALRDSGIDPGAVGTRFERLAQALLDAPGVAEGAAGAPAWSWGIGPADTVDVDTWCWDVIHAFGGALADPKGERVQLASPETVAALEWIQQTFAALGAHGRVPPAASEWPDDRKNAAFLAGDTGYTFTERLLPRLPAADGRQSPAYLLAPAGPVNRPRVTGGGAAWYVPRGAPAPLIERLIERLLEIPAQQAVWRSGGGAALPAFEGTWDDAVARELASDPNVARFRQEMAGGGFASATGNAGPETASSQGVAEARLGAAMLRAVVSGRAPAVVMGEAQASAAAVFRDFGLPG